MDLFSQLDSDITSCIRAGLLPVSFSKTVLVLGSGGREHAIAHKLSQSHAVSTVLVYPGNGGTARCGGKIRNVIIDGGDKQLQSIVSFAKARGVDLVAVGPEQPLVDGIVELMTEAVRIIYFY